MMMRFVAFSFIAVVTLSFLAPDGAAQIRLNEIVADPQTDWNGDGAIDSKKDEWVEIMNVGAGAVDLANLRITDDSAGLAFRYALSGMLAPGQIRVFFGSDVVTWQTANGVSAFGFSLNNGGDTVYLYDVSGGDTTLVDSRGYASAETAKDRAIGRLPNGTGDWVVFDALNTYTGSTLVATGCRPSPGVLTQCVTGTETSSWGTIKFQFAD